MGALAAVAAMSAASSAASGAPAAPMAALRHAITHCPPRSLCGQQEKKLAISKNLQITQENFDLNTCGILIIIQITFISAQCNLDLRTYINAIVFGSQVFLIGKTVELLVHGKILCFDTFETEEHSTSLT